MVEYYLDAKDAILGRLASYAAKKAIEGNKVYILNAEEAVILGSKKDVFKKYWLLRSDIGGFTKGPHYPKMPHRIVKRVVRGMIPHKKKSGKEALSRVVVHIGLPKEFKGKELKSVYKYDENKALKVVKISELAKHLGWKGK